jgi:translocation and assembly module TamB
MATPKTTPAAGPFSAADKVMAQPWRALRGLAWAGAWVFGAALALLLAGALAFWIWAATAGSLATSLGWAQSSMQARMAGTDRFTTEGVEGSLRAGGRIASLDWKQGALSVQAKGVQLEWNDALWTDALMGRGVHLASLRVQQLSVNDERAPTPTEPMASLVLPLPVSLAIQVDRFDLSGNTTLGLSNIQADYAYGPVDAAHEGPALPASPRLSNAHRLRLDSLQLADGRYEGNLSLGAEAPMPLALALVGQVQTQVPDGAGVLLTVHGQADGTLAGAQATIAIQVEARGMPDSPHAKASLLALQARVMPWARQPLVSAVASAQSLNLAALWPTAPVTDLSGQLQAQPEGDTWRARLQLDNARIGPADKKGLPLQSLRAAVQQQGDRWTISKLLAQIGGGSVQGQGSLRLNTEGDTMALSEWQGDLKAKGIRPALLWSELAQGALDGQLSVRAAPSPQSPNAIAVEASVNPSARQPDNAALPGLRLSEVRVKGQWHPTTPTGTRGTLDLSDAHIAIADAQLDTQGRLDTSRMSYDGQMRLRLPGASLDAKGLLAHAKGQGTADLQLLDAARLLAWVRELQSLPLVGPGIRAALAGQAGLRVKGAGNAQLQWTGGLGALGFPAPLDPAAASGPMAAPAWPRLQAALAVPRMQVQTGTDAAPTVIEGLALKADGPLSAMRLSAAGSVAAAPWRASLESAGLLRVGANPVDGNTLNLSRLALRLAPMPKAGEKSTAGGWQLANAQPLLVNWKTTAEKGLALDAGAGELQLRPLSDRAAQLGDPLTVAWQRLVWQANALETQGRLQGLSLPWIEALAAIGQPPQAGPIAPSGVSGDLVLDGAWNVRIPADTSAPLDLSATLQRRSGDLRWSNLGFASSGASPNASADAIAAGVKDARISLVVNNRQLQALLRWDSERLGQVSADAATTLSAANADATASLIDRWWPASTPIKGSANARLPEVGVWSMFTPPGWRMKGTLTADATLSGTRGTPQWRGSLQGDQLALRSVVDGFSFTNGQLRATLAGDRINVDRLSLQGPGGAESGGTLLASGQAEWRLVAGSKLRQPFIDLTATAQRLRVSSRVDRRLTLSGDVTAQLAGPQLQMRGQLKVDSALFILPDELAPSLSKDVVVRSTRTLPTEEEGTQRVQPDVSVSLDLGQQFEVRGQGIDTRLEGQLTVRATPALPAPRTFGEVRTVSGTYKAYGQQLNIETGVLRFAGPYDDPALDIVAVRKLPENTDQRVGVKITGNAQAPRVGLFAEPDLPDGDKLAWLVLGKPASGAGAQAFVLQQAARKLLSRGGEPVDGAFAKSIGLDDIGFAGPSSNTDGTTTQAALTVGKRLSDSIYLSYEQSLAGTMSAVSILYDLSKRLTLRARAGTENAIDVIFTHRYE